MNNSHASLTDWAFTHLEGGTSLSSPLMAGIVNASGNFAPSTNALQTLLYGGNRSFFNDITVGSCGVYLGYLAGVGWDNCSGNGSHNGYMRPGR
jgi:hypothetical protein